MANKKGTRRRFGAVRQYRSGRWPASYRGPDGQEFRAPETFETKKDAEVWLSQAEADLTRGDWQDPDAGAVNFKEYALQWVDERGLSATTEELYRRLLRLHLLPTFEGLDLDEITAPRVRTWRAERLSTTGAPTTIAKSYRLRKAVMETAVDDELIRPQPLPHQGSWQGVCCRAADRHRRPGRRARRCARAPLASDGLPRCVRSDAAGGTGGTTPQGRRPGRHDHPGPHGRARAGHRPPSSGRHEVRAGKRFVVLPAFLRTDLRRHLDWYAEKGPDGLLFVGEKGAPFRHTSFGRKWRKARDLVGMPDGFRFYDLRHTGHTLATRSGATLKDTMVRAGQSSEKAALIYQHSDLDRQQEVASGLDELVRAARQKGREGPSGADLVRDA